jgi:hypothetical protein
MTEQVQNPIKSKLSANQIKFAKWLALPSAKRKPKTQAELSDTLKVNCATLSVWKTIPEFRARVDEEIARWADEEDAEVIEAMILTAQTPGKDGTADRKLYLQWRGKLVEKIAQTDTKGNDIEPGSTKELLSSKIATLALRKAQEQEQESPGT